MTPILGGLVMVVAMMVILVVTLPMVAVLMAPGLVVALAIGTPWPFGVIATLAVTFFWVGALMFMRWPYRYLGWLNRQSDVGAEWLDGAFQTTPPKKEAS